MMIYPCCPVVFAGGDPATHVATLATHGPPPRAVWPATASQQQTALPHQFAARFAPTAQPETDTPWEIVPFQLLSNEQTISLAAEQPMPQIDWIAWAVFVAALGMILLALL